MVNFCRRRPPDYFIYFSQIGRGRQLGLADYFQPLEFEQIFSGALIGHWFAGCFGRLAIQPADGGRQ